MKKIWKKAIIILLAVVVCFPMTANATETSANDSGNKYNVVFVIDESGSMLKTDADKLRYEATDLFMGLMSQKGNYVGTVSFDDSIIYSQKILPVSGAKDKTVISDAITKHSATNGDTDIGNALNTAVNMLVSDGNPDLPSNIILLTDGNTDLDNDSSKVSKAEEESIQKKSSAISSARNSGIKVYSVCLNENGEADFSETKQISDATGGEAQEVKSANDLKNVFEMFYQVIYGSDNTSIYEGKVPVNTSFIVPDVGVEEANIMIQGKVSDIHFKDPSGKMYTNIDTTTTGDITLEKIVNPAAGKWTVSIDGDPGATVKVNLLYNYNFIVKDNTKLSEENYQQGDEIDFSAQLTDSSGKPLNITDKSGYAAEVRFVNEKDEDLEAIPMEIEDGNFELEYDIPERDRAYRYYIAVTLNSGKENSATYKKTEIRQFVCGSNTAPVSNGDITATVKLWPFRKNVYELDLTTLAKDAEDSQLKYSVISTSFVNKADDPDGDFSIKDNVLTQDQFSLRSGDYVIRCVDSGGLYCDVTVTVKSIPIGLLTMLAIIVLIVIAAAAALFGVYKASKAAFNGDIYIKQSFSEDEIKRTKNRGRMKLNVFNIPIHGLDTNKSYFQAMGGSVVTLVTDKEVTINGRKGKEHVIPAGLNSVEVRYGDGNDSVFYVRFVSRLTGGIRRNNKKRKTASTRRISSGRNSGTGRKSSGTGRRNSGTGRMTRK